MKKLVMLLFVLVFSAPSFAELDANDLNVAVLCYKVTIADKPAILDANFETGLDNNSTMTAVKNISYKGYLIFKVHTTNLDVIAETNGVADSNQDPILILKGKNPSTNAQETWVLTTGIGNVEIDRYMTTATKPAKYASLDFWSFEGITDSNQSAGGEAWGKMAATVLVKGSKVKVEVPKSLKGTGGFVKRISPVNCPIDIPIDGTVSLTLDAKNTQEANKSILTVKALADLLD